MTNAQQIEALVKEINDAQDRMNKKYKRILDKMLECDRKLAAIEKEKSRRSKEWLEREAEKIDRRKVELKKALDEWMDAQKQALDDKLDSLKKKYTDILAQAIKSSQGL